MILLILEVVLFQPFYLSYLCFSTTEHNIIQHIFILKGNDEDDAEDENNLDKRTNSDGPSAKRPKTPSEQ